MQEFKPIDASEFPSRFDPREAVHALFAIALMKGCEAKFADLVINDCEEIDALNSAIEVLTSVREVLQVRR
jgi:hypothetical protein